MGRRFLAQPPPLVASCVMLSVFLCAVCLHAPRPTHAQQSDLSTLCNTTTNPSLCLSTLSSFPSCQPSALLQNLTAFIVSSALAEVNRSYSIAQDLAHELDVASDNSSTSSRTLQDCLELLDSSQDGLQKSMQRLSQLDGQQAPPADTLSSQVMDVRVWLSASLTDLDTCWEELADAKAAKLRTRLEQAGQENVEPLLSIALTLAQQLQQAGATSTSYALPSHDQSCAPPSSNQ